MEKFQAFMTLYLLDRKGISSIVNYLVTVHGYNILQPYFTANLDSLLKNNSKNNYDYEYEKPRIILSLINVTYVNLPKQKKL